MAKMIEESAQQLQADFRVVEANLRTEMNRNVKQLMEETRSLETDVASARLFSVIVERTEEYY